MGFDLVNIQPNKVSRDLSGYITYIYGAPKTGKTTLATQMGSSLLLAFEPGYHALPGVKAVDVTSWTDMRQIYRELKKDEVKSIYKAVIVDTIDIAADRCKKYVCDQNDIEDLTDLGFGKGWTKFKEEFNEIFRNLSQLGYAIFFLGHDKEHRNDATGLTEIRPALSNSTRDVIAGMADIYGYAHQVRPGEMSVLTLRSGDGRISCGSRFKYMPDEITMSYENLTKALNEAIEKEAAEHGGKFVTDEKIAPVTLEKSYDFEALIKEFEEIIGNLMSKDQTYYAPRITEIVDKYLGKGKKVSDATRSQAEFIYLIVTEIKEDLLK